MAFDFKKEYREFYMPKAKPEIVTVPEMNYIAVRGSGDPNAEDGEYKTAIGLLYTIAFTIKMSNRGSHRIEGYFDYVVPPLEGFWWQGAASAEPNYHAATDMPPTEGRGRYPQEDIDGLDSGRKEDFCWISVIRLPDFVTKEDFLWAVEEATIKKKQDFSKV